MVVIIISHKIAGIAIMALFLMCTMQGAIASNLSNGTVSSGKAMPLEIIYKKPKNYTELVSWYKALEKNYSNYLYVFDANTLYGIGNATGGYNLTYLRITNESTGFLKPEVFIMGPPHGDETAGTAGAYWFVNWSMRTAFDKAYYDPVWTERLRWYFDNREVYIEAVHNPYGLDNGPQRGDGNGWDLNRETDYDCCGSPAGGTWASANGKTVREFIDHHQIRIAADLHGGIRALISPWHSNHDSSTAIDPINGKSFTNAPPDFYYYEVLMHKTGDFVGAWGGDFNSSNVGPMAPVLGYKAQGAYPSWGYAADVKANPVEDPYVDDETFGNYNGSGIFFTTFEISTNKDVTEQSLGGDVTPGYGLEVRRFILDTIDMAQPYLNWMPTTAKDGSSVLPGSVAHFEWQVNGSMVVDNTYVQWSKDPDPSKNPLNKTKNNTQNAGKWFGGTGWDNPNNGKVSGTTYSEDVTVPEAAGDYYFAARAIVDQRYNETIDPATYGKNHTYLRMLKERLWGNWNETINGTDGKENMTGRTWWSSPVIKLTVLPRPHVNDTYPANRSTNISRSAHVFVNFSEEMDKSSSQLAFQISPYKSGSFTWSANNSSMEFTPYTMFSYLTNYSVTIGATAKSKIGLTMSSPYKFWFITQGVPPPPPDIYPPHITYIYPSNGSVNINISQMITISFNESMNHSAAESAITLTPSIPLTASWSGFTLQLTHTVKFTKSTNYTLVVDKKAKDLADNALDQVYTIFFRTEVAPPPPPPPITPLNVLGTIPNNGAKDVAITTNISIVFNKTVDKPTFKWSITPSFYASVLVLDRTVTIIPFSNLTYNTTYMLIIYKDTTSKDGGKMPSNYVLTFTTAKEQTGPPPPPPQEPVASMPMFWFAILIAIVVATLLLILIIGRKGKKEKEPVQAVDPQASTPTPPSPLPPPPPP